MTRTGVVLGAGGVLGAAWSIGALAAYQSERQADPRDADVLPQGRGSLEPIGTLVDAVRPRGACSPTSLDLVGRQGLDEVVVLSPMTSFDYDTPATVAGRMERRFRRIVSKRLVGEIRKVAATGTKVTVLAPGAEDLAAIGANLMDASRRERVLETSLRTSAVILRADRLAAAV